jgi:hypothetical protein
MVTTGRVKQFLDVHGGTAVVDGIGIGAGVVARLQELGATVVSFAASDQTRLLV